MKHRRTQGRRRKKQVLNLEERDAPRGQRERERGGDADMCKRDTRNGKVVFSPVNACYADRCHTPLEEVALMTMLCKWYKYSFFSVPPTMCPSLLERLAVLYLCA